MLNPVERPIPTYCKIIIINCFSKTYFARYQYNSCSHSRVYSVQQQEVLIKCSCEEFYLFVKWIGCREFPFVIANVNFHLNNFKIRWNFSYSSPTFNSMDSTWRRLWLNSEHSQWKKIPKNLSRRRIIIRCWQQCMAPTVIPLTVVGSLWVSVDVGNRYLHCVATPGVNALVWVMILWRNSTRTQKK